MHAYSSQMKGKGTQVLQKSETLFDTKDIKVFCAQVDLALNLSSRQKYNSEVKDDVPVSPGGAVSVECNKESHWLSHPVSWPTRAHIRLI